LLSFSLAENKFRNVLIFSGWLIVGMALLVLGSIMGLFPRTMPRTVQRQREALRRGASVEEEKQQVAAQVAEKASLKGL
jgi:hypothetical protein